jgi:hypothetical protein
MNMPEVRGIAIEILAWMYQWAVGLRPVARALAAADGGGRAALAHSGAVCAAMGPTDALP